MRAGYENYLALLASRFVVERDDMDLTVIANSATATLPLIFNAGPPEESILINAVDPGDAGNNIRIRLYDVPNTPATLTTNFTLGSFLSTTIITGPDANFTTIEFVDPMGNDIPLAVSAIGSDITVTLGTGPGGAISSTIQEVANEINGDPVVGALIQVTNVVSGGELANAVVGTNFTGGTHTFDWDVQVVDTDIDIRVKRTNIAYGSTAELVNAINTDVVASTLVFATETGPGTVTPIMDEGFTVYIWQNLQGGVTYEAYTAIKVGTLPKYATPVLTVFNGYGASDTESMVLIGYSPITPDMLSIPAELGMLVDLETYGEEALVLPGFRIGDTLGEETEVWFNYAEINDFSTTGGPWYFTLYYTWGG